MVKKAYTREEIFSMISVIPDPEIPVVNILEMGMLRDVVLVDDGCEVMLTPTYTGCPAMDVIAEDIKALLEKNGVSPVTVTLIYHPPWSTDSMTEQTKQKLARYGIAPPLHSSCAMDVFGHSIVKCPQCHSDDTVLVSRFGSTACKSLYKCNDCKEPFEYFKCH